MGTDLNLLPFHAPPHDSTSWWDGGESRYTTTVLALPRNYELFEAISELEQVPVGTRIAAYAARVPDGRARNETMFGVIDTDRRGDPLVYVWSTALARVMERLLPGEPVTAFISAMRPGGRVVLWWH